MAQDYNRIMSADDVLKQTIEVRDERRSVPVSDILSGTLLCLKFNEDWFPHIIGAVHTLQTYAAWIGDDDDSNAGTRQITKLLAQDMTDCGGDCPDPLTIPIIIADDTYFETEYVPVVFGKYYSETVAQATTQAAVYDDTPQSVAPLVPVSAPDAIERNALCYAINRFVELYSSQKLCLIQSQSFIEVFLSNLADAANDFYNAVSDLMLPFYSANIFSCFVDNDEAMTALQDSSAIEELACYIYEYLKPLAMSQANFDDAVLDAATMLTGNAQDIACLMQNDNSEDIFITFLLGYNIAIERQANGDNLECPCETDTYWMLLQDFTVDEHDWRAIPNATDTAFVGEYSGSDWRNKTTNPPNSASVYIWRNFDAAYIVNACAVDMTCDGFTANGSDFIEAVGKSDFDRIGTSRVTGSANFLAINGNTVREFASPAETNAVRSYYIRLGNVGSPSGTNYSRINKAVIYGTPVAGNKPQNSVWVSALPTTGNYFP